MTPQTRHDAVQAAMSWLGTPYHHQANIKGVGVDCVMLLVEVYKACGLIPQHIDPRPYVDDWHMHRNDEIYLAGVEALADITHTPLPGDIALFKFGRCVSHAAIVITWPLVIHAYLDHSAVVQTDISKSVSLTNRLHGVYTLRSN